MRRKRNFRLQNRWNQTARQVVGCGFWVCLLAVSANAQVDFSRDIQPIFRKHCYECHGPETQRSGYRLDVRDVAQKGGDLGEAAIISKNAATSPLFRFVSGEEEEMLMPPKASGKPRLTSDEVITIRTWLDEGAIWPDHAAGNKRQPSTHWSLKPLALPQVQGVGSEPIDNLIRENPRPTSTISSARPAACWSRTSSRPGGSCTPRRSPTRASASTTPTTGRSSGT